MSTFKNIIETPYGPIPISDGPLKRKARLLQGYYRKDILRELKGTGPDKTSTQHYCNMLLDGKESGANFITPEIFQYAKFRCHDKRNVETIEEFRLFNNMLSSQPMCFNLFVPLRSAVRSGDKFVDKVLQKLLPDLKIERVINIEVEYIPVPIDDYINDKSAFDAFVEFRSKDGEKGAIGIETKYVDSLGTNNPKDMKKKHLIANEIGCFTSEGLESIKTKCPQLVRNFMLTEKYRMNHSFGRSQSIILALQEDSEPEAEIQKLKKILRPEFQSKIAKISLEDFVTAIGTHCPSGYRRWITKFQSRYLDMKKAVELGEAVGREW